MSHGTPRAGDGGTAPTLAAAVLRSAEEQQLQRSELARATKELEEQRRIDNESIASLPKRLVKSALSVTDDTDQPAVRSARGPASTGAGSGVDASASTRALIVEPPLERQHIRSIVYCALCFFVLFSAWSPAQSYVTTVQPQFGSYAIILIYVFLGAFGLLAPLIINRVGVRAAFVASSAAYGTFMLALASGSPALLGVASCLVGAGGGVLWVNQGLFIKAIAADAGGHVGYLTGLWFSVYSFAPLAGNTLAGLLLRAGLSLTALLLVVASIAAVACAMFLAVRSPPIDPKSIAPLSQKLRDTREVMRERAMQALMLWMTAQGLAQAFQFAVFPSLVTTAAGDDGSKSHVGFIFALYGVMAVLISYAAGKAMDARGWRWVMYPYIVVLFVGYGLCALGGLLTPTPLPIPAADGVSDDTLVSPGSDHALALFYCCGVLFGVSDGLVQVLINATVVLWYGKTASTSAAAFATYRVTGSATWVLGVLIRLLTNALGAGISAVVLATIAFGNFWFYQTRVRPGELALAQLQREQREIDLEAHAQSGAQAHTPPATDVSPDSADGNAPKLSAAHDRAAFPRAESDRESVGPTESES